MYVTSWVIGGAAAVIAVVLYLIHLSEKTVKVNGKGSRKTQINKLALQFMFGTLGVALVAFIVGALGINSVRVAVASMKAEYIGFAGTIIGFSLGLLLIFAGIKFAISKNIKIEEGTEQS